MTRVIPFRPKLLDALQGYNRERFRQDFIAGLNVTTLAFPLSMAFAIASGVKPEQGLVQSPLLLLLLLVAAPLISHIPLATLSAVLVVAAFRMVS